MMQSDTPAFKRLDSLAPMREAENGFVSSLAPELALCCKRIPKVSIAGLIALPGAEVRAALAARQGWGALPHDEPRRCG